MKDDQEQLLLSDGRELIIRQISMEHDLERMIEFFSSLPRQQRNYLRYNVTNPEFCKARLQSVDEKDHWRLLAEVGGRLVGEGSMDREPFGWTHHIAHLRTVVDPKFSGFGIGTVLLKKLVEIGSASGIERFYSEVIKEHTEMIQALMEEGFVHEVTRKEYAKDINGKLHDVLVMSNDQSAVWRKLEDHIEALDIKRSGIQGGA